MAECYKKVSERIEKLLVVSKFEEDISWIEKIQMPCIIYDKSKHPYAEAISRPNIGREAETLLYFIITNYRNLPKNTIFLQGDPRSNPVKYSYEEVIETINNLNTDGKVKTLLTWEGSMDVHDYWLKSTGKLHDILFGSHDTTCTYSSGVQYVIPDFAILHRPLEFYALLYMLVIKFGNNNYIDRDDIDGGAMRLDARTGLGQNI